MFQNNDVVSIIFIAEKPQNSQFCWWDVVGHIYLTDHFIPQINSVVICTMESVMKDLYLCFVMALLSKNKAACPAVSVTKVPLWEIHKYN